MSRKTALYRFYGEGERLLYAGITYNPVVRIRQHERSKLWWQEIRRVDVEWFPTRREADKAERKAISTERPFYNDKRPAGSLPYWEPPGPGWWVTAYPVPDTRCEICERSYKPRRYRLKWVGDRLMTRWVCSSCRGANHWFPSHPEFVEHVGKVGGGWMRDGREA